MGKELDRSVLIGVALLAALLAANAAMSLRGTRRVHDNAGQVAHTHEAIAGTASIRADLRAAEAAQRAFLLSGDEPAYAAFRRGAAAARDGIVRLATLTSDNLDQQARLSATGNALSRAVGGLESAAQARRREGAEAGGRVAGDGRELVAEVERLTAAVEAAERDLLAGRTRANDRAYADALLFGTATAAFGLLAVGLFAGVLVRSARARAAAAAAVRHEREWLRTTLASIGDAVIATDPAGRVTFLNPVAEALTGWPQAEAAGRPLTEVFRIVNETTREGVENPALRALREGVVAGLASHTVLIARDGADYPIDDSSAPIRGAGGAVTGAVLVFRDITEKKAAERAIREREGRAETILESITDGFFAVDRAWRFTYANRRAEHILGREPDDLLGLELWDVYPGLVGSTLEAMYRRVAATGASESATMYYPDHDRWYAAHAYPAPDGLSVYFGDVTSQQRAEGRLRKVEEQRRLALDAAELGSWNLDPATATLATDARFRAIFGVAGDRVEYERAVEAIHPDDRARVREAVEAATRPTDPVPYAIEYRVVRPDGAVRWVSAKGRANFGPSGGRVVSLDGTVADVTERVRAERAARSGEERLRTALAAARMVAWEWTPSDLKLRVSENAADVFGLPPGVGLTGIDQGLALVHPDDVASYRETFQRAIRERGSYRTQYRLVRPSDSRVIWIEEQGHAVFDQPGGAVRLYGVAADVTARRATEELVRASEERYRTLFAEMDAGFCVIEVLFAGGAPTDYRFLEVNPAFEHHTGLRAAAGRTIRELSPDHEGHWFETYGRVAQAGEPVRFVDEARALGRWFDVYAFPFGGGNRVAVLFTDITARRRGDEEREHLVEQLRDADRKKDDFIALLAHELRNPLAPIRNGLQVIRLAEGRADRERSQRMMDRQLAHMVRMIDDLLDVSRINRNKMALRRARVTLAEVVASAVETAKPVIEDAGHDLIVALPPTPVLLDADLTRLSQVFSNLLANSAKYTARGGTIRLTAEPRDGAVAVAVRDTGIGIPAGALPTIFDMFSQVDRSAERGAGGLGIGLALVKGLVEMHGGTVTARSDGPGRGSEFAVTLPALPEQPAATEPAGEGPVPASRPNRRILVVDDNRDSAESLATLLGLLSHDVVTAHDGLEAVERAERFRPEVVLMDIGMPRLDGLEATRRIRAQPWGAGMTIVALTGWGQDGDRKRTQEAGCDGHLVKPVSFPDLERVLADVGR